jgi:hypothetical protein
MAIASACRARPLARDRQHRFRFYGGSDLGNDGGAVAHDQPAHGEPNPSC